VTDILPARPRPAAPRLALIVFAVVYAAAMVLLLVPREAIRAIPAALVQPSD
jgi:hypothetical protein